MASVCLSQNNYHLQLSNSKVMLLHQTQFKPKSLAPASTKALGITNLKNKESSFVAEDNLQNKKYSYSNTTYGEQLPSVARRNARERNRVKQVNNGFSNLRQHIPQSVINALSNGGRGASKKLSKVDTLRIAVEYIRGLQDLLGERSSPAELHFDELSNDGSNYEYARECSMKYNESNVYCSEASASPTHSYTDSDISIGGTNFLQPVKTEVQPFEYFGTYSPNEEQPDDEELLDYISSWQEQ